MTRLPYASRRTVQRAGKREKPLARGFLLCSVPCPLPPPHGMEGRECPGLPSLVLVSLWQGVWEGCFWSKRRSGIAPPWLASAAAAAHSAAHVVGLGASGQPLTSPSRQGDLAPREALLLAELVSGTRGVRVEHRVPKWPQESPCLCVRLHPQGPGTTFSSGPWLPVCSAKDWCAHSHLCTLLPGPGKLLSLPRNPSSLLIIPSFSLEAPCSPPPQPHLVAGHEVLPALLRTLG